MHKIQDKEFTLEDFSTDKIIDAGEPEYEDIYDDIVLTLHFDGEKQYYDPYDIFSEILIPALNLYREKYIETKDKKYWWQMIQLLPSSYNQTRNVMLNYEVLANIYKSRRNHKLNEWREFCKFVEELPYSELICGDGALITQNEQRERLEDVADKFCEIGNINPLSKEEIEQAVNLSRILWENHGYWIDKEHDVVQTRRIDIYGKNK